MRGPRFVAILCAVSHAASERTLLRIEARLAGADSGSRREHLLERLSPPRHQPDAGARGATVAEAALHGRERALDGDAVAPGLRGEALDRALQALERGRARDAR